MKTYRIVRDEHGHITHLETSLKGQSLLDSPHLNKGSAFTKEERANFDLTGKLPYRTETLENQIERRYRQYLNKPTSLEKNIFLNVLHDTNETLFYRLVSEHLSEMLPVIYTPTEAEAIEDFSAEIRRPRGLHICYEDKDRIPEILKNRINDRVDLMVVTDAEQILGIGDQGCGGVWISMAKLVVYTLCAKINPHHFLPIQLDVGTNNQKLLNDPLYLGWRHPRIEGREYEEFIGRFVSAVKEKFPWVYLQWEDFGRENARKIVEKYRDQLCCFNDDMQGTGAVTLAALLAAVKSQGETMAKQRVVIFGAGTAGVGIADQIKAAMTREGLSEKEAYARIWLVDKQGLLTKNTPHLIYFQQSYCRDDTEISSWQCNHHPQLEDVIENVHPTALIGCSTVGGTFTEKIVRTMYAHVKKPIIFPLSNPTSHHEATPEQLLHWTDGNAMVATGSPFDPVSIHGKQIPIAECNNAFIYPGFGLGVIAVKAKKLTDNMIWAACEKLTSLAPIVNDPSSSLLLPSLENIHSVSRKIAQAVALQAIKDKVAEPTEHLDSLINKAQWEAKYYPYKQVLAENLMSKAAL